MMKSCSLAFLFSACFGLILFLTGTASGQVIVDLMSFESEPRMGMSRDIAIIYEWEATLRDEAAQIKEAGERKKPSARTIEYDEFFDVVRKRKAYRFIVIDIESLKPKDNWIAAEYVRHAKNAAPRSRVAWWNIGPGPAPRPAALDWEWDRWFLRFENKWRIVEENDFCIMAAYFKGSDTLAKWRNRNVPRIEAARYLYNGKPIMVVLSPHPFNQGRPWRHVSEELMGGAIDACAEAGVDYIPIWSEEGLQHRQQWNEKWGWVKALRKRIGSRGRYQKPGD